MQTSKNDSGLSVSRTLRVRWSTRQDTKACEQLVALVQQSEEEFTLLSPVSISENTQIYLTGDCYMESGIVRTCERVETSYLLTVSVAAGSSFFSPRQEFDPGVLDVDNFLTEEEEAKILDSLGGGGSTGGSSYRGVISQAGRITTIMRERLALLSQWAMAWLHPVGCY